QLHGAHGGWNRHRGLSSPRNTRTRDAADEDRLACRSVMRLWGPSTSRSSPGGQRMGARVRHARVALRRMLTKGSGGPALIAEGPGGPGLLPEGPGGLAHPRTCGDGASGPSALEGEAQAPVLITPAEAC